MHSFKTCAHSFDHLNGLASIDVFSAPLCEGRSLAKLPHLEHMSPGVWTESNSAGTHNELLSSLSKVSSWFILTSYKKSLGCPAWGHSYGATVCWFFSPLLSDVFISFCLSLFPQCPLLKWEWVGFPFEAHIVSAIRFGLLLSDWKWHTDGVVEISFSFSVCILCLHALQSLTTSSTTYYYYWLKQTTSLCRHLDVHLVHRYHCIRCWERRRPDVGQALENTLSMRKRHRKLKIFIQYVLLLLLSAVFKFMSTMSEWNSSAISTDCLLISVWAPSYSVRTDSWWNRDLSPNHTLLWTVKQALNLLFLATAWMLTRECWERHLTFFKIPLYQEVKKTFRGIWPLHANQNSGFRAARKGLLMLSDTLACLFTPRKQISVITFNSQPLYCLF